MLDVDISKLIVFLVFQLISNSPQYQLFLEHILRTFIKVMMEGQPQFISEHGVHVGINFVSYGIIKF